MRLFQFAKASKCMNNIPIYYLMDYFTIVIKLPLMFLVQFYMVFFVGPLCRVNPLTDRGKRFQLIKILCLTVIPILGVWGFTMYSLSDSVKSKSDIEVVGLFSSYSHELLHQVLYETSVFPFNVLTLTHGV